MLVVRELTRKATRELIYGLATLGVYLGLLATGHQVPDVLGYLVFALVINGGRAQATQK